VPSVAARAAAGNNDVQGGQARVVITDHSLTFIKEHHDRQRQWAERAGDSELAEFFRKAQADSRKGGVQGKALLKSRLDR